jgi:endonuclease YncB( thermonuclease family)
MAAEVLQVRGADLLQVGDRNRSYRVELACLRIHTDRETDAEIWLREQVPRRTRVNLHPMGEREGVLLARVSRLDGNRDLSSGLIAAGLATAAPCPTDPISLGAER